MALCSSCDSSGVGTFDGNSIDGFRCLGRKNQCSDTSKVDGCSDKIVRRKILSHGSIRIRTSCLRSL